MKNLKYYIDLVEGAAVAKQPLLKPKKPLRPVVAVKEEELDEITRRDFLKGAGAAVGAAALGAMPGKAKADARTLTDHEEKVVQEFLTLYYFIKFLADLDDSWKDSKKYADIQSAISRFGFKYNNGREYLNRQYSLLRQYYETLRTRDPDKWGVAADRYVKNAQQIINNFNSLTEF